MSLFSLLLARTFMSIPVGIAFFLFIYFIFPEPFFITGNIVIPEKYSFTTTVDGETVTQYATRYVEHPSISKSIPDILATIFLVSFIYGSITCFRKDMKKYNGKVFGILDTFTTIMDQLASNCKTTSIKTMSTKNIDVSVKTDKQVITKNVKNNYLEKNKMPTSIKFNIDGRIIPWFVLTVVIAFGFMQNTTKENYEEYDYDVGYDDGYEGEHRSAKEGIEYKAGYKDGEIDADCEHYRLRDSYSDWVNLKCYTRPYEPRYWQDRDLNHTLWRK